MDESIDAAAREANRALLGRLPEARTLVMGILNVTPDSFSDGGEHATVRAALDHARRMVADGADIVDVGGESTRPGARAVPPAEEQERILPVIEALLAEDVVVSVDTRHTATARAALALGPLIVNDVSGLAHDPEIPALIPAPGPPYMPLPALADSAPLAEDVAVGGDGPIALLFTSGTTGRPKGVPVPLRAAAAFAVYLTCAVDLRPEDLFWNAADHGWAYGLYYGIVGTLMLGATSVQYRGAFSPATMVEVIRSQDVTNLAGAPTMFRALAKAGEVTEDAPLRLRRVSTAGEPLPPSVLEWGRSALGTEIRDHYGQTELGMVICTPAHPELAAPPRPGSMGVPLPGIAAEIRDGQIAIDAASPLFWFPGYLGEPEKTAERFTPDGRWYLTGDTARQDDDGWFFFSSRDDDGWFFFSSRDDDVILAAGYRIGPFDVESVLIDHPRVQEVAVVGLPDPEGVRGEEVVAFVVPAGAVADPDALAAELQAKVRDEYSKHAYPRRVHFVDRLPKTPSGKLQRFLLRQGATD
ncbi:AMP-dependent synthetase [Micrococcus sp. HSID17228]|uniref:dihydropteroate synthase n=1 Tax=Micrococcus sp. HSID17228 TaxID=2419507 RepID=UPI000FAC57EE|nr:dihydropteroate synthase [Micrococcus sp. HSID17228]RUQ45541.1 AMP-dependent synthetase [Micrococcus sp. HSID17228]